MCHLFPGGSEVKNPHANAGDLGDKGSIPGSGRSPGVGNGIQMVLLEISHGQRSLAGYSPYGCKGSNKTEHTHKHLFLTVRPFVNYVIPLSFWFFLSTDWQ